MKSRKAKARELAFYVLFSSLVGSQDVDDALKTVLDSEEATGIKGDIEKKIRLWKKNREEIDKVIEEHLKKGSLESLSSVALSILRLGFCEMVFDKQIPPAVAINESVAIAKTYGDPAISRFVNAVMDAHLKSRDDI